MNRASLLHLLSSFVMAVALVIAGFEVQRIPAAAMQPTPNQMMYILMTVGIAMLIGAFSYRFMQRYIQHLSSQGQRPHRLARLVGYIMLVAALTFQAFWVESVKQHPQFPPAPARTESW